MFSMEPMPASNGLVPISPRPLLELLLLWSNLVPSSKVANRWPSKLSWATKDACASFCSPGSDTKSGPPRLPPAAAVGAVVADAGAVAAAAMLVVVVGEDCGGAEAGKGGLREAENKELPECITPLLPLL